MHQGDLVAPPGRALERVADDPLDAVRGVDADLGGDLVPGCRARTTPPLPQYRPSVPSRTTTKSISLPAVTQSASGVGTPGEQPARPQVHVVVEGEPQLEQQAALEQPARHVGGTGRRADRAEQDRVGLGELGQHRVGQHLTGALPAGRAQVVGGGGEGARAADGIEHLEPFGDHLRPDPVAADDGEVDGRARPSALVTRASYRAPDRSGPAVVIAGCCSSDPAEIQSAIARPTSAALA